MGNLLTGVQKNTFWCQLKAYVNYTTLKKQLYVSFSDASIHVVLSRH